MHTEPGRPAPSKLSRWPPQKKRKRRKRAKQGSTPRIRYTLVVNESIKRWQITCIDLLIKLQNTPNRKPKKCEVYNILCLALGCRCQFSDELFNERLVYFYLWNKNCFTVRCSTKEPAFSRHLTFAFFFFCGNLSQVCWFWLKKREREKKKTEQKVSL